MVTKRTRLRRHGRGLRPDNELERTGKLFAIALYQYTSDRSCLQRNVWKSSKMKLIFILVLKCYSMTMSTSLPMTLRMVIMILKQRKTEIALVAWEFLVMKIAKESQLA